MQLQNLFSNPFWLRFQVHLITFFLWPRIKSLIIGLDLIFMLDRIDGFSHDFCGFWKVFFKLSFREPYLALLNLSLWSFGVWDHGHFVVINDYHIIDTFAWFHIGTSLFIGVSLYIQNFFFLNSSANLALYASFKLNFILIWELRRIECHVDWSMALTFKPTSLTFQSYDFYILLILETWINFTNLNLMRLSPTFISFLSWSLKGWECRLVHGN